MSNDKFNWGILGPGGIARAFAKDLTFIQGHAIAAVGSRSLDNAQKFSADFGGAAYGSYEEFVADPTIDAVYVATPHPAHHDNVVLDETTPQHPINAYGASKRAIEDMLRDFGASNGVNAVVFRYFNVAGADPEAEVGEFHRPETHLIPLMLDAIDGKRGALTIFGTDYDTPDGTCIRDYVHVCDLVDAHVLGLKWLEDGRESRVFNLGTGMGFSVREVVSASRTVTNRDVPIIEGERRAGDCTRLVSGSSRAVQELGWRPKRSDMATMIADAWRWHQSGSYER